MRSGSIGKVQHLIHTIPVSTLKAEKREFAEKDGMEPVFQTSMPPEFAGLICLACNNGAHCVDVVCGQGGQLPGPVWKLRASVQLRESIAKVDGLFIPRVELPAPV